jgi:hypothetical protein
MYIAEDKEDFSICETLGTERRDKCYSRIATSGNKGRNIELCNYIRKNESRYNCYITIAGMEGDLSICEKYLLTYDVLIQEGIDDPKRYSKEGCIGSVKAWGNL